MDHRRPDPAGAIALLVLILVAVAACSGGAGSSAPPAAGEPSAAPMPSSVITDLPDGNLVRVEQVDLSEDGLTVTMRFTGAKVFDATDPCSRAYGGFAAVNGDVLEIAVVEAPHPMVLAEGMACDAMGHARVVEAVLPEPFMGTEVRDRAGGSLQIGTPAEY